MRAIGFRGSFARLALASGLGFCVLWSIFYFLISGLSVGEVLQWGVPMGLVFGLAFGWVMAYSMQLETTTLDLSRFEEGRPFLQELLQRMGYRLKKETAREIVFKPSLRLGLFTGEIVFRVDAEVVTVEGPSHQLRRLTQLLAEVRRAL